jgi:hypothetical protein
MVGVNDHRRRQADDIPIPCDYGSNYRCCRGTPQLGICAILIFQILSKTSLPSGRDRHDQMDRVDLLDIADGVDLFTDDSVAQPG